MLLLGDFIGGALVYEHLPHWVELFEGERFSVILFNSPSLSRRLRWLPLLALRRRLLSSRAKANEAA